MKTISLLLAVIIAIILEKALAEYLLVEVGGKDEKGTPNLFYSSTVIGSGIFPISNNLFIVESTHSSFSCFIQISILSTKGQFASMNILRVASL